MELQSGTEDAFLCSQHEPHVVAINITNGFSTLDNRNIVLVSKVEMKSRSRAGLEGLLELVQLEVRAGSIGNELGK